MLVLILLTIFRVQDNPLGHSTLDADKFKSFYLNGDFNFASLKDLALKGDGVKTGSRTFGWRLFLGVVPDENTPAKWLQAIR